MYGMVYLVNAKYPNILLQGEIKMIKFSTKLSAMALATAIIGGAYSVNASAAESELQLMDSNESTEVVLFETEENKGVNEVAPGLGNPNEIIPYGTSKPEKTWNLSTSGRYGFSGYLNSARSLYTDYLLTGKSSVKIWARNHHHQYDLKFRLMRKDLIFDNQIGIYSVPVGKDGTVNVSKLDSSKNYYIEFIGVSDFSGYIE